MVSGIGIQISAGAVSNVLIKQTGAFEAEDAADYQAGLRHGAYQHYKVTPTPVKGVPWSCHIVDNPQITAYFTRPRQNRFTVLEVLRGGAAPRYLINEEALSSLTEFGLPAAIRAALAEFHSLVAATQKLGVNFWHYVHDHLTGAGLIPPLALDSPLALS